MFLGVFVCMYICLHLCVGERKLKKREKGEIQNKNNLFLFQEYLLQCSSCGMQLALDFVIDLWATWRRKLSRHTPSA